MRDDRDRQEWFQLLDRVVVRCGGRFFAWVLMDNHFHLIFQTPEANLAAGMHELNSGYATRFNRRYRRAETRCGEQRRWKQRLSRLEDSLRSRE